MVRKPLFLPEELHTRLKNQADKNHRTMVGEVEALLNGEEIISFNN